MESLGRHLDPLGTVSYYMVRQKRVKLKPSLDCPLSYLYFGVNLANQYLIFTSEEQL
jgi:hypothetical protein